MIVWAGCMTCRTDKRARKWEGLWVDESVYPTLTVYDVHQPGNCPDIDEHVLHAFTLSDFGVPDEQSEEDLRWQAAYAQTLDEAGVLEPMAVYAVAKGLALQDVDYAEFLGLFAGTWYGKPTRAARKRYAFSSAGDGAYFMWRRQARRPIRHAVEV